MKNCMILLIPLVLLFLASNAPAHADIQDVNWIGPLVKSEYDSFYGTSVTGYRTGSTASLVVNVHNHLGSDMNVSAVKVSFDWGINYTSTEANETNIFVIRRRESHVFTITFTVPDTTLASNLVRHGYVVYAEDVNATAGSKRQLYSNWPWSGSNFVVFSIAQADVRTLTREIAIYESVYTVFFTAKARELSLLARGARNLGDSAYLKGDFSGAVSYYQSALSHYQNAWSNETAKISGYEDSIKGLLDGGKSVLTMMSWGYILLGAGFLFMGIGVMVYLVRKSGTPKASQ